MDGNADYITFDFSAYNTNIERVEFDVTIPKWEETKNTIAYHWGNASNTQYTIQSADKEMVQLTAPANAKSFTIQRSAGTGTRISNVCFQLSEGSSEGSGGNEGGSEGGNEGGSEGGSEGGNEGGSETEVLEIPQDLQNAHKILVNGQLVILRDGKTYTVLGSRL
jgi:uncharacterized membrane protein YgcG